MGDLLLYGTILVEAVVFAGCVTVMRRADALERWQSELLIEIVKLRRSVEVRK
jgi:hypothetical protein